MRKNRVAGAALVSLAMILAACSAEAEEPENSAPEPAETTPEAEPAGDTEDAEPETEDAGGDLFSQLPQEIQDRGTIIFAGDSHPPYRTVADDGTVSGIDADFQEALAAELGVEIEVEIVSGLPAILSGMLSGRYDAFNGPVRSTEEREADFDSIVWLTTRTSYVFLADDDRFSSSDDLCGVIIAGTAGSVTESQVDLLNQWCVDQGEEAAEFLGLADTNATILAVQAGRADALGATETAALDILRADPDTFDYVTQTEEQGAGLDLLAMFAPKDSGLGPVLFEAVQNMFDSGAMAEIAQEWELENVLVDEPMFNPITEG